MPSKIDVQVLRRFSEPDRLRPSSHPAVAEAPSTPSAATEYGQPRSAAERRRRSPLGGLRPSSTRPARRPRHRSIRYDGRHHGAGSTPPRFRTERSTLDAAGGPRQDLYLHGSRRLPAWRRGGHRVRPTPGTGYRPAPSALTADHDLRPSSSGPTEALLLPLRLALRRHRPSRHRRRRWCRAASTRTFEYVARPLWRGRSSTSASPNESTMAHDDATPSLGRVTDAGPAGIAVARLTERSGHHPAVARCCRRCHRSAWELRPPMCIADVRLVRLTDDGRAARGWTGRRRIEAPTQARCDAGGRPALAGRRRTARWRRCRHQPRRTRVGRASRPPSPWLPYAERDRHAPLPAGAALNADQALATSAS
jgi:hypothetical protein